MTLARLRAADPRPSWKTEDSRRLEQGLALLALNASGAQVGGLQAYGELLLKWNRTYNLLGAGTGDALVQDHLLDSLATLPVLTRWLPSSGANLLDVGSGAGLPGIVLAIMLDDLRITLVEPNGKKAAFLRQAVARCKLRNVSVAESRIEDLAVATTRISKAPGTPTGSDDLPAPCHFICRAFTSLNRYTTLCRPYLGNGSLLFAMKAVRVREEVSELDSWVEVLAVEPLDAAGKDVQRNLVVMRSSDPPPVQAPNIAAPLHGTAPGGLLGNHSDHR
jgi:16S rRNA (guanine527-N7)-methyltransferase